MSGRDGMLSAREFVEAAKARAFFRIAGQTVVGEVNLSGLKLEHGLEFRDVTFESRLDLSDVELNGTLDLTGCRFLRTVRMSNARIAGSLLLDSVVVEARARQGVGGNFDWNLVEHVFDARNLAVRGAIQASDFAVSGRVDWSGSSVGGSVRLLGSEIRGGFWLDDVQIDGSLQIGFTVGAGLDSGGRKSHRPTYIGGDFRGASMRVGGNISLTAAIDGQCLVHGLKCPGAVQIDSGVLRTTIRKDLHLAGCELNHLAIRGVDIGGTLQIWSSRINRLIVGPAPAGPYEGTGCRIGGLLAAGARIETDCSLQGLQIFRRAESLPESVSFRHATIGGSVLFWSPGIGDSYGWEAAERIAYKRGLRASVVGNVDFSGAAVGGELDLTNLTVDGSLILDDAEVGGDILCRSEASLIEDVRVQESQPELVAAIVRSRMAATGAAPPDGLETSVRRLSLVMLQADNDVDLSGLRLRALEQEIESHGPYGHLVARNLQVKGRCALFWRVDQRVWQSLRGEQERVGARPVEPPENEAAIPGRADFSDVELGQLTVGNKSFRPQSLAYCTEDEVVARGLLLPGARIGTLELVPRDRRELPRRGLRGRLRPQACPLFPAPMNLAEIEVQKWEIGESDRGRFRQYCSLLECDPDFRQSTYLSVEASLRNRGYVADGDRVYRAMKRRGWRVYMGASRLPPRNARQAAAAGLAGLVVMGLAAAGGSDLGAWLLYGLGIVLLLPALFAVLRGAIWDIALGFGTAPARLLLLVLLAFVLSTLFVYSDHRNIAPTLEAKMVAGLPPPARPAEAEWGAWEAFVIGTRSHVPLVTWAQRDEWELADDRPLSLNLPGAPDVSARTEEPATAPRRNGWAVGFLSPQDFGLIMQILNLLAWPPILAFAIRRAFRQS